jgi:shikimate kinase
MPGCGKTTVGKLLAKKTGLPFYDADIYLEEKLGRKIPDIINSGGESEFRRLETEALAELTKISGCIIATGGGAVLAPYNRYLIKQNGICVYLQRDIQKLATKGRPLSAGGSDRLKELYSVRHPLYSEVADIKVELNENAGHSCEKIIAEIF